MAYRNDNEQRLAYYEAKMNYYASKLEDIEGGDDASIAATRVRVVDAKKALEDFNNKLTSFTQKQVIDNAPFLVKEQARLALNIKTLEGLVLGDRAATSTGKFFSGLGTSISAGIQQVRGPTVPKV